jgi:hypothetical protein
MFQADNVILTEVVAMLDLNEHERNMAGVPDPVGCANRDTDCISSPHVDAVAVKSDDSLSANHEPNARNGVNASGSSGVARVGPRSS